MSRRTTNLIGLALIGWGLSTAAALAADFHAGPQDYREFLPRLAAGDRLLLRAGDYTRGLPLHGLHGEAGRPILIEGPATAPRARFIARDDANTISLADVRHIQIRNLELDGRNLPVDAVKAEGHAAYAHFVTLENLYIHDHAASQQNVGISTKCPAFGWIIRGNRIERVGTGLYLGNSDGSAPFVAGLIEHNQVSDTLGYNLQIKHQKARPESMQEAGARHDTIIRRNFFAKITGGPPGPMARPNVLLGHLPLTGDGMADRYLVYANLFWQNPGEALFQGEGNLDIRSNIFVNTHGAAIRIQPHNDVPRCVSVLHNTVLAHDLGILLRNREAGAPCAQRVNGNLILAGRPLAGDTAGQNFTAPADQAARYLLQPSGEPEQFNASPVLPVRLLNPTAGVQDYFGASHGVIMGAVANTNAGPAYGRWLDGVPHGD
jgi:hypothetical protein